MSVSRIINALLMRSGSLALPYFWYRCRRLSFANRATMVEQVTADPRPLFKTIRSNQNQTEITGLLELVGKQKPQVVVEIGTAAGGTLLMLSQEADPAARIISIDIPNPIFVGTGGYPRWKRFLFQAFVQPAQSLTLLRANSHQADTKVRLEQLLAGQVIDFLFIDGDHSYDGVKQDFEMYSSLVRPGGLVAFHDIVPGPERKVGGVPQYWQDLKAQNFETHEFVADWSQERYGIGVVTMPAA